MIIKLPFNRKLEIILTDNSAVTRVNSILRRRLNQLKGSDISKKIVLIKLLREDKVSKILIDANLVPDCEVRHYDENGANLMQVGLVFAKNWVEEYFTIEELAREEI